jgi:hypothetical protein
MQNVGKIYADKVSAQMDGHTLNPDICWFCDKPVAEKESAEIYLNKHQNTHLGLTGNTYEFLVLSRSIPCCRICRRTHERADKWSGSLMIPGGIGGFIAGVALPFVIFLNLQITPDKDFNGIVFFSMVGGAVSGVILGYLLGQKIAFAFAPGTKPQTHAKQHPLIKPLIEQGWRLGKPE